MINEQNLISACKEFNPAAQRALYHTYAPRMKAVCLRYSANKEEAKDILQEGFIKIFSKIGSFSEKGSLEGWIKRIIINTSISYYNKNKKHHHENIEAHVNSNVITTENESSVINTVDEEDDLFSGFDFSENELIQAINFLPDPFRIVFNLFYIENNSHKDISEMLSIEENTSRTRLHRAKKVLQKHLKNLRRTASVESCKMKGVDL